MPPDPPEKLSYARQIGLAARRVRRARNMTAQQVATAAQLRTAIVGRRAQFEKILNDYRLHGAEMAHAEVDADVVRITAGAGQTLGRLCSQAQQLGLTGLEFAERCRGYAESAVSTCTSSPIAASKCASVTRAIKLAGSSGNPMAATLETARQNWSGEFGAYFA